MNKAPFIILGIVVVVVFHAIGKYFSHTDIGDYDAEGYPHEEGYKDGYKDGKAGAGWFTVGIVVVVAIGILLAFIDILARAYNG